MLNSSSNLAKLIRNTANRKQLRTLLSNLAKYTTPPLGESSLPPGARPLAPATEELALAARKSAPVALRQSSQRFGSEARGHLPQFPAS